jgi:transglutaminase-like putative cysteine protease
MIVHVEWRTRYTYSLPVRQLHSELCVVPGERANQRVTVATIRVQPPARLTTHEDEFGNLRHTVDFVDPTDALDVTVRAEVETIDAPEPAVEAPSPDLYLQPSARAPFAPELDEFIVPQGSGHLAYAWEVMAEIAERFAYEVGFTDVADTALDLLHTGRGVCQDFSHLMLAVLRRQGVPARYVSGYLAAVEGDAIATASHAWVQVLDGGAWYGFDPANNARQDERYVVTAVGRDYDDVPPIRGTYFGHAEERWSTEVRIATPFQ